MASAIENLILYVYPNTIQNINVIVKGPNDDVLNTYTISDFELCDGSGEHGGYGGSLMCSILEIGSVYSSGTVVVSSTGCQTQTISVTDEQCDMTLEPTTGYKKLYAWTCSEKNATFWTDTEEPTRESNIYDSDGTDVTNTYKGGASQIYSVSSNNIVWSTEGGALPIGAYHGGDNTPDPVLPVR